MDITEEIREEVTMSGNIKITENKTGDDSTETENSEKSKSNERSEPSLDKPNPKDMKITLLFAKSDENSFSNMSRLSQEDYKIPKKKKSKTIPKPLVTAHEVTQDPYDMEKGDKFGSSIDGSKQTSVCVTPHISLQTPPKYINKRDYKVDTLDKTLDSLSKYSDV